MVVVDPLFISLRESLIDELDRERPAEISATHFSAKPFFDHYLSENRPLVIRGYASEWQATQKWTEWDYLTENAGNQLVRLHAFTKKEQTTLVVDGQKPQFSSKPIEPDEPFS